MAQAARASRRRASAPYRRKPLRRETPTSLAEALRNFLAPVAGGIAVLLLYILGLLDVKTSAYTPEMDFSAKCRRP